jgi:hypothetical protein
MAEGDGAHLLDFCVILYLYVSFSFGGGVEFSGDCAVSGQFATVSVQIFP